MNPKHLIPLVLAAAAILVAGCGEKEEPSTAGPVVTQTTTGGTTTTGGGTTTPTGSDRDAIDDVIRQYLTRADAPGACTKLVTPQFVKRSYGNEKGCEAARKPSAMAKALTFPAGGGNGTTVTVKPQGGVFGGETLEVTMINLDGQWTIDKITSNAKVGP